jgi:DNA-binding transcriptional ArsR family regulator
MSVQALRTGPLAATLLAHPLRPKILARARQPISASELARQLGQPRQRVNYHVRQLARAGLLRSSGQNRKRNMVEQNYVASAQAYVLSPELLEAAGLRADDVQDSASATQLLALYARAQSEVVQVMESASAAGLRVRTMSMQSDLRFETAEQRAEFTRELLAAVTDVIARHSSPFVDREGEAGAGRPFRLLVGCYPVPGDAK